jgi:hypothetical protein
MRDPGSKDCATARRDPGLTNKELEARAPNNCKACRRRSEPIELRSIMNVPFGYWDVDQKQS